MELLWNDITEEELKHLYYDESLSDNEIVALFGVTKGKVTYKRNKFGISIRNKVYQDFMEQQGDLPKKLNEDYKQRLLNKNNIDMLSKAITHFVFRNGPVENMHSNNQLSEEDMKTLNKYMVNRMAGLLTAIADNNWMQLELLLSYHYQYFGSDWDKVEPDVEEVENILKYVLK